MDTEDLATEEHGTSNHGRTRINADLDLCSRTRWTDSFYSMLFRGCFIRVDRCYSVAVLSVLIRVIPWFFIRVHPCYSVVVLSVFIRVIPWSFYPWSSVAQHHGRINPGGPPGGKPARRHRDRDEKRDHAGVGESIEP